MRKLCFALASYAAMNAMIAAPVQAQSYCENGAMFPGYFWIDSVISGSFDNTTGPVPDIPPDFDRYTTSYADYTDQMIAWQVGLNPLELVSGTQFPGVPIAWQVWIDLDSDQVFSTEELVLSSQSDVVNASIDLSSLQLDSDLSTRMRVSLSYGQPALPCGSFLYGEVEDYTVTIEAPVIPTVRVPEDFTSIQAAIDAAMPGDRVLVNDGTYNEFLVVDKPLKLESVNGYTNTVITGASFNPTVLVQAPDVRVKGFDFAGSVQNLRNVQFEAGADGGQVVDSRCGFVSNPGENSQSSILINGADNILVDGFICNGKAGVGIDVNDSHGSRFVNNVLTGYRFSGIFVENSFDTLVENNVLNEARSVGLGIKDSERLIASSNDCSRNVSENGLFGIGINSLNSTDIVMTDNTCHENGNRGIGLTGSDNVQVLNNSLIDNRTAGIVGFSADFSTVDNNTVDGSRRAVILTNATDLSVTENTIRNADLHGLYLSAIQNSTVADNVLIDNVTSLSLLTSNNNVVKENLFDSPDDLPSSCKIRMTAASGNAIYLNEFKSSGVNQFCISSDSLSQWNSPSDISYEFRGGQFSGPMGNYYSDGSSTDSGMDGIADQPYLIDGGQAIDDYPLAYEVYRYNFN